MAETETQMVKYQPQAPVATARHFRGLLERFGGELAKVLAEGVDLDRLLKVAMLAIQKNPALLDCTQESVLISVMESAQLGLEIGGIGGEAYLVPFNNRVKLPDGRETWQKQAQLIPGYRGKVKLMRHAGAGRVAADVVYEGDEFSIDKVDGTIHHVFDPKKPRGEPIGAWALIRLVEESHVDYMDRAQIERRRAVSKQPNGMLWTDWWEEAWKKTVVHLAAKLVPMSVTPPPERRALSAPERLGLAEALEERSFELPEVPEEEAEAPAIQQGTGETKTEAVTRELQRQKAESPKAKASTAKGVEEDLTAGDDDAAGAAAKNDEPKPGGVEDLDRELGKPPEGRLLSDAQIEAIYTEIKGHHPPDISDDQAVREFDQAFLEAFASVKYKSLEELAPVDALPFGSLLGKFGIRVPKIGES